MNSIKQSLNARCDELQDHLDIIVTVIGRENADFSTRAALLERARVLNQDLEKLRPEIAAFNENCEFYWLLEEQGQIGLAS